MSFEVTNSSLNGSNFNIGSGINNSVLEETTYSPEISQVNFASQSTLFTTKATSNQSCFKSILKKIFCKTPPQVLIQKKFPEIRPYILSTDRKEWTKEEILAAKKISVHEILPSLFLGDYEALKEAKGKNSLQFRRVVTLNPIVEKLPNNPSLRQLYIWVDDLNDAWPELVSKATGKQNAFEKAKPEELFSKTFKFIDQALIKDERVLIHCLSGVSRSASIVIAYIMNRFEVPFEAALNFVKNQRPQVKPNEGFINGLIQYGQLLSSKSF